MFLSVSLSLSALVARWLNIDLQVQVSDTTMLRKDFPLVSKKHYTSTALAGEPVTVDVMA